MEYNYPTKNGGGAEKGGKWMGEGEEVRSNGLHSCSITTRLGGRNVTTRLSSIYETTKENVTIIPTDY